MARPPIDARYSGVAIAFHWTIALLVIVNLGIGLGVLPGSMPTHKAIGITVLVLTLGRVAWRLGHRPPPLPKTVLPWQRGLAHATHWALYLLLLAMPLSGWAMVSGTEKRRPLEWFGAFDIPYLPVSSAVGDAGANAHGLLGWLMLLLVMLHVAAALFHQFVQRDRLIARMMPGARA